MFFLRSVSIILFFFICSCTAPVTLSRAESPADGFTPSDSLTAFITNRMAQDGVYAASLCLAGSNGLLYARGYGMARPGQGIQAAPQTLFRAGSISKVFTALAVMQLAERGLLVLDNPVSNYLPDFKPLSRFENTPAVTPRMLLSHHSGLPADRLWNKFSGIRNEFRSSIEFVNAHELQAPPGLYFNYCNTGYAVLGVLIEKLSGMDYASYMKSNILVPLDMTNSTFYAPDRSGPLFAQSLSMGFDIDEPDVWDAPAGSLWTSSEEMARFIEMACGYGAYRGRRIISRASFTDMTRPDYVTTLDFGHAQGLGFDLEFQPFAARFKTISHGGGTICFFGMMAVLPDAGLGAVMLTAGQFRGLPGEAVKRSLSELINHFRPVPDGYTNPAPARYYRDTDIEEIEGLYATGEGLLEIKRDGTNLRALLMNENNQNILLKQDTNYWFSLLLTDSGKKFNYQLGFTQVNGNRALLKKMGGKTTLTGFRVNVTANAPAWDSSSGPYRILNEDELTRKARLWSPVRIQMTRHGLVLQLDIDVPGTKKKILLAPLDNSRALVMDVRDRMGGMVLTRFVTNGRQALEWSGYILEKE